MNEADTNRDRQTDRQTEKETETERISQRQTGGQTDRHVSGTRVAYVTRGCGVSILREV